MFLNLAHTEKNVFEASRNFRLECYPITKEFLPDERFAMAQQIRRAALSTHVNVAEGCFRKPETERKHYFEVSRGSVIEADAALYLAFELGYKSREQQKSSGVHSVNVFKQLTGLIG